MGLIKRIADIISANANAAMDRIEAPEKMLDQYMRNLYSELGKVKAQTAFVMAEVKGYERKIQDAEEEIKCLDSYAEKALSAGNEEDSKVFIRDRMNEEKKLAGLKQAYEVAAANAEKIRQMHDELSGKISEFERKKDALKTKAAIARTENVLNEINSGVDSAGKTFASFERMEEKINKSIDKAEALASLEDPKENLKKKYTEDYPEQDVEAELEKLRNRLHKKAV